MRQQYCSLASTKETMESVNIYPELTKWRTNKHGLSAITIRFDFKRARIGNQPLNQSILPSDWDPQSKRVKKSNRNHELLNLIIETTLNKHNNYFLKRKAFGLLVNKELVKKYISSGGSLESFYDYAETIIDTKLLKDGKCYSPETKRCYLDELKRMKQFSAELSFRELTVQFLEKYKIWLQNEYYKKGTTKRLDENSIWKAFKFIRMVYNESVKNDIIPEEGNPFKKFKVGAYKENTEKIKYLERNEMERIEQLLQDRACGLEDLTIRIGWRFLAMCVSGMRISDAMHLDELFFNCLVLK